MSTFMSSQGCSIKEHEDEDERGRRGVPYHHNQPPTEGNNRKGSLEQGK